jgi:hypothetical protein
MFWNSAGYPKIDQLYQNLRKLMGDWRKHEVIKAEKAVTNQQTRIVDPNEFEA